MSRDTLTAIKESQEHFRNSATAMCALGGVPAPETERDWLKFSLNQGLRMQGIGKPLPWNPPAASEPAEEYMSFSLAHGEDGMPIITTDEDGNRWVETVDTTGQE